MNAQTMLLAVPISRKTARAALAGALTLCGVGASTAIAGPVTLVLPQSTAFAILGHSCGGIQEKSYATGFDPASGYPIGDVYIKTSCGGSGRGGGAFTQTVPGTSLTAGFTVDFIPDWTVMVRAHNAAGWGPGSAGFTLGGL